MRKSITITIIAGALSPLSIAAAEPFSGPFVGSGAGVSVSDPQGDIDGGNKTSAAFNAYVGYDYLLPRNFVVGVEAGAVYAIDDDFSAGGSDSDLSIDPRYEINATARLGYLIRPDILVYARGGYATLRTKIAFEETPEISRDLDGWLVGGGVEYAINQKFSGRVEYRYQDLDDGQLKLERNQVLAGLTYHF